MNFSYYNFLQKTLNVKKEDIPKFSLLFLHSFAVNYFISFQFVGINSVFVNNFGGEYLPYAYMVAGVTGYIVSLLYAEFQKRVSSKFAFIGALVFMFVVTLISRLGVGIIDDKILAFFSFIWAWPFISLVNIESGGVAIHLLNLRQVKRLFGLINIGGIISAILSYFAIPLINPFLSHTYDLLLVSEVGLIAAVVIVVVIFKRYSDKHTHDINVKNQDNDIKFKDLFKERYFVLMMVSAALSMIMIYFTDYGYLSSIKEQPDLFGTPEAISSLLAIVCGAFKIGELIISYFSNRLLSKWGVKIGLSILPIVALVIVVSAGIVGFTLGTASIVFFGLMVINKSSERILRRGLDDPSFNILYQPLSGKIKLAVQAKVGIVMQISIGFAGIILWLVSRAIRTENGFELKYYILFFLPFLLGWIYVSRNLFGEYKKRLRQILADMSKDKKREGYRYNYADDLLQKNLKKHNEDVVRMSVMILAEANPTMLEPYATQLLEIDNDTIKKSVLLNIEPTWRKRITKSTSSLIDTDPSTEIKKLAKSIDDLFEFDKKELSHEEIDRFINSDNKTDRLNLITYLSKQKSQTAETVLLKLLDDKEHIVKTAAIKMIARINNKELLNKLISFLQTNEFCFTAGNCILDIGDKIIPNLEKLFETKTQSNLLVFVVEILAKMGSNLAKSLLVKHINYPDHDVQDAIVRALYFCRFQANSREMAIIKAKLDEVINNILWIYATLNDIEAESNTLKLVQSIDLERENYYEQIFELLSFLYDPKVINLIKKNIIGENTIFALEIIDNFINQDMKQIIIPLFDDISRNQRLKNLNNLFPQEKLNLVDRLKDIIVRDYNKIEPYTIAKAIELLGKLHKNKRTLDSNDKGNLNSGEIDLWTKQNVKMLIESIRKSEMPDEIFAALYHNEEIVYSTAAQIIYEENPTRFINFMKELTPDKQKIIPILQKGKDGEKDIITRKIRYIKRLSLFFTCPENILVKIARISTIIEFEKNEKIFLTNDNINDIFCIIDGKFVALQSETPETIYQSNDLIVRGLNTSPDLSEVTALKKSTVMQCNRYEYFAILASETALLHHMFEMVTSRE